MDLSYGVGDRVRLRELPEWVPLLTPESQEVLRACVGLVFPIVEITAEGMLVLDVSDPVDRRFGGSNNDIRVEARWVEAT